MSELPKNWISTTIGELALYVQRGKSPKYTTLSNLPVINQKCIRWYGLEKEHVKFIHPEQHSAWGAERYLRNGDILWNSTGTGTIGRACIYKDSYFPKAVVDSHVTIVRFDHRHICPEYAFYFIASPFVQKKIEEMQSGSTNQVELGRGAIVETSIPLPPTNEQKRIVAKIEELFSKLDSGVESLKTAREQLKVYRQAVLKHAFEGKLTAAWREKNKDKLESADQLLTRIKREREEHYQQQLKEWSSAVKTWEKNGSEGKKPTKPKILPHIAILTDERTNKLPALPLGWAWFDLASVVTESILGKMLDKEKNKGTLKPYLRNVNVRWGEFDLSNLLDMRFEDTESERYSLKVGDLVICEGGEPGRCAIWKNEMKEIRIQKALHRVRVCDKIIKPEYLYYCIVFSNEIGLLRKYFTGTTIKHLTGEGLSKIEIPVCTPAEQDLIVERIESIFSNIASLEKEIESALQGAEALRQSILKKAFYGELVAQDPADEPASVLLERIRTEKAVSKPSAKKPKEKRKAA